MVIDLRGINMFMIRMDILEFKLRPEDLMVYIYILKQAAMNKPIDIREFSQINNWLFDEDTLELLERKGLICIDENSIDIL